MNSRHIRKLAITLIVSVACKGSEQRQQEPDSTASVPAVVSPAISAQPNSDDCGDRTIHQERVGKIAIGDPVDSLRKCSIVRDTVVQEDEGGKARMVSIAFATDTIRAQIVDGRVWRIEVSSPGIRTVDSLGVGTPLSRLLQMSNPRGASGEGRMYVLSPDHCGQSFQITYQQLTEVQRRDFGLRSSGGWTRVTMARLPDTTHVIRVLVTRCHPELYR